MERWDTISESVLIKKKYVRHFTPWLECCIDRLNTLPKAVIQPLTNVGVGNH